MYVVWRVVCRCRRRGRLRFLLALLLFVFGVVLYYCCVFYIVFSKHVSMSGGDVCSSVVNVSSIVVFRRVVSCFCGVHMCGLFVR